MGAGRALVGGLRHFDVPSSLPPDRLFVRILWGIGLGMLVGLVLGDLVRPLNVVASAFIRLLQVNVLPYLLGSLIASLGSRGSSEMRVIATEID